MSGKSVPTTRLMLVAGMLLLTVLLFIAPRTRAKELNSARPEMQGAGIAGMETLRGLTLKNLGPEDKNRFERLSHNHQFDSIQDFWLRMKQPQLIALTAEEKAISTKKAEDFFDAGKRYYNAVRFATDDEQLPALYEGAVRCLSKGLELKPGDTDARILLASCYVEGSADPMKGIQLLREVEKTDSNNVKLQMSFAFFSIKSGQLDKAEARLKKAIAADSTYLEAYLHLADVYERQSNPSGTISMLEEYARRTDDVTARLEVNKYIDQLKKKHNN